MADYQFLQNPISKQWVILAPRRAKRPDVAKGTEPVCPFCPGREGNEGELYRVGGQPGDHNWHVRVLPNKFPFADIHEIIVDTPLHDKSFGELEETQVATVLQVYRQRYNTHQDKGQVYIFHNRGEKGGESLPHSHTQLVVLPKDMKTDIPRLDPMASVGVCPMPLDTAGNHVHEATCEMVQTPHFYIFAPKTAQWPDEVWIAPKVRGRVFGEITDEEITDFAHTLTRLIQIFDLRHGSEFPYNFYLYPGGDWYLRLTPRLKTLGGFEIGTGIFVNTQDPNETIQFIKAHFLTPNEEKIQKEHQANYGRGV